MTASKHVFFKHDASFDSKIIRFISIVLVVLILSIAVMYYLNLKTMYASRLQQTNDSLTEQVGISYETTLKNITDSIFKIPLYDDDMIKRVENYSDSSEYRRQLFDKLSSIVLGNQYLFSAYLYYPSYDIVYNSDSGCTYSLSDFDDRVVFQNKDMSKIYLVDPRLVQTSTENTRLLMSVVLPVPLSSLGADAMLVVNIDAGRLYADILKQINTQNNMNLYVYNNQKVILFSKDQNLLFKQFNQKLLQIQSESSLTTSNYYSTTLKWTFVLQTTFRIPWQYTSELLAFLIFLSLILLLGLVIISLMVRRFSIPMKKILINYNDGIWRDYLTGVSTDRDSIVQQLKNEDIHPGTGFTILLIQDIRSGGNCGTSLLKNVSLTLAQLDFVQQSNIIHQKNIICKAHIVAIENSLTAVALIVENVYPFDDCHRLISDITKKITEGLESDDRESIYIGVGQFKDNIALIPISYREAREALNYKIVTNAHIITYPSVMERSAYYEYPYDIEKQLVNNILTGDVASSEKYIDQFFAKLAGPDLSIQDNEIKAIIYQLETAIFRGISSLPIPVKLDTGFNLPDMPDMQSVRQSLSAFVYKAASEISCKNKTDFSVSKIFEYLEKRYIDDDFNLNTAADELDLNRNYLAKVVREHTGETFNDYISHKRVETAKHMLQKGNLTIEKIAHKVGFNYAHYFIKVFKSIEGITPGQYREQYRHS